MGFSGPKGRRAVFQGIPQLVRPRQALFFASALDLLLRIIIILVLDIGPASMKSSPPIPVVLSTALPPSQCARPCLAAPFSTGRLFQERQEI